MKKYLLIFFLPLVACEPGGSNTVSEASQPAPDTAAAAVVSADDFIARANAELAEDNAAYMATAWVRATYLNEDTALLASQSAQKYAAASASSGCLASP